jgi:hypothetical protein
MTHPRRDVVPVHGLARARSVARLAPALALLLLAAVLGGCSGDALGSDAARVLSGSSLEVAVDDGWEPAVVGDPLPAGARVRTGDSEARLELRAGEAWLAPGSMAVVSRDVVDAIRGDVLVRSEGRLAGRWGDAMVAGTGSFRLTPGVTPLVRVYDGMGAVRRPGEERAVESRRELSLATTRLAAEGVPLSYDPEDPWDRRLLPRAVAFDDEIARLARGIDRQHGTEPQEPAFYETFSAVAADAIPLLASVSRRVLPDSRFGPPSDALVTLFVAEGVTARGSTSLAEAAREVTRWRQRGARWGLVALELDITSADLAQAVDLGQERRLAAEEQLPTDAAAVVGAAGAEEAAASDGTSRQATGQEPPTRTSPPRRAPVTAGSTPTPPSSSSPPPPPSATAPAPQPEPPPTLGSPQLPSPSPSPSPPAAAPTPVAPDPVDAVTTVVEDVVDGLLDTTGSLLGD